MLPAVWVLDTCVLLSNPLRRLCFQLAARQVFQPAWSPIIGDEWQRNAQRLWGTAPDALQAHWQAIQQAFPQANQGDVSAWKQGLQYSDAKDWHVIAAARAVQARRGFGGQVGILTRNTRDFNRSELKRLGLLAWDPDRWWWAYAQAGLALPRYVLDHIAQDTVREGETLTTLQMLKRERLFRYASDRMRRA